MTRISRLLAASIVAGAVALAGCGSGSKTGTSRPPQPSTTVPNTTAPTTTPAPSTNAAPPVTVGVHVWFLNQDHSTTGEEPLFEPVDRRVKPPALAAGSLDALFAGPTTSEQAAGLRLVTSGATGYTRLHIEDGITYVTLAGGCASGGSTMTIAGEIMPTLRQFASVSFVKIFAPDGTTENPTGPVDSIPTCLEP
jgi:Sporulation and spore germination